MSKGRFYLEQDFNALSPEANNDLHYTVPGEHQPLLGNDPPIVPEGLSDNENDEQQTVPKNAALIIFCVACMTFIGSFLGGLITVDIPQIASELKLEPGCIFTVACGLSQTGTQLIAFRIMSGVAISLCLPSAMSINVENFPAGKLRNMAFAFMGGGQPIGFGTGVIVGGVFADTIGWRWGFYSAAIASALGFLLSLWQLPLQAKDLEKIAWEQLVVGIDWVGTFAASASMAFLLYALAVITDDVQKIRDPDVLGPLILSGSLLVGFVVWQRRQEILDRPTVIRNSLWRNTAFTAVCMNVFLIWGSFNATEQVINFVFQRVQGLSVLATSWQFLPIPISGTLSSLITGLILHRVRADIIISTTVIISSFSPIMMALSDPAWSYWKCSFPAIFLNCIAADSFFTISNMIIAGVFPAETQGLAAGVFNTISQIGKAVGMALTAMIANAVTEHGLEAHDIKHAEERYRMALMSGYRAAFYFLFAMNITSLVVSLIGLRKIGYVGRAVESRH
ncbi:major facilitator superfamily domain-containing protein [Penicillium lagena]|uniref:major facilitator superfamily domain-containing protein n=1 Tax=Penicillium lagena TaxID=94218 RepID=UPI002540510C|nr:major facilitator superfamily domain-containing protein [Penicillium lagena]KAJ5624255.1 major facilitator superfamily domain-containing protein [Penicillium lagena]